MRESWSKEPLVSEHLVKRFQRRARLWRQYSLRLMRLNTELKNITNLPKDPIKQTNSLKSIINKQQQQIDQLNDICMKLTEENEQLVSRLNAYNKQ